VYDIVCLMSIKLILRMKNGTIAECHFSNVLYNRFLTVHCYVFVSWDPHNHTWQVTEKLRPSVVNLDWQRKGKTVYKSVNFAGYIGILTAMKPVRYHQCPRKAIFSIAQT
jgi:hypothetical protein